MGEGAVAEAQGVLLHKENTHANTNLQYIQFMAVFIFLLCGPMCKHTHLVALTAWATWLAGLLSVDVMSREEGVWWTLLTLVGVFVYEVSSRTGDTGRAALLTHHGAGVAGRGRAVQCVRDGDGVDLCNVTHITPDLRETHTRDIDLFLGKTVIVSELYDLDLSNSHI